MSPLLVLGLKEETQQIPIEVFSSYEDDQENPVTDVFVEIQSRQIQFYSVTLHITAHFSGLRYIMFHWPILSASIGWYIIYFQFQMVTPIDFFVNKSKMLIALKLNVSQVWVQIYFSF